MARDDFRNKQNKEGEWVAFLRTQIFANKMLILHGNVEDYFYSPIVEDFVLLQKRLEEILREVGYTQLCFWDRLNGADNTKISSLHKEPSSGVPIDFDDESSQKEAQKTDTTEFFAMIRSAFMQANESEEVGQKRVAFIANYASFAMPNATQLDSNDKKALMFLRECVSQSHFAESSDRGRPQPLIILIVQNLAHIPLLLSQNNASIRDIAIPMPDRATRETFINMTTFDFSQELLQDSTAQEEFIDHLEGFSIRDILHLRDLLAYCTLQGEHINHKDLIYRYKYGTKTSPWESLNKSTVRELKTTLKKRVKGQDSAVDKVAQMVLRAYTGLSGIQHSSARKTPKGALFFVGPTGVGKTELAKALAQALFGDEDLCIRFDMSEYNHEHSDQRLVGAPPGYVGYEEGGQLTNALKKRPFCVLLFDEIEKAHPRILDKFLQILEDGRLTDGRGETVSFTESVIIFTSNIGASTARSEKEFIQAVQEHFRDKLNRPELLNRIGNNITAFNHIDNKDILREIIQSKLSNLEALLQSKYKITSLDLQDSALNPMISDFLKQGGSSSGGRGILNAAVDSLIDPISNAIFESDEYANKVLKISRSGDGGLKIEFV